MTPPSPLAVTGPQPFVAEFCRLEAKEDGKRQAVVASMLLDRNAAPELFLPYLCIPLDAGGSAPPELVERLKTASMDEPGCGHVHGNWHPSDQCDECVSSLRVRSILAALGAKP